MDLKNSNKNNSKSFKFNDSFLFNFCTEYLDGRRKLILNGNDLFHKIGRRIEDDDIYNLTAFLKKNPDINALNLAYNSIYCQGFIRLINFLITNDNIIELNIQNNEISSTGIKNLCSKAGKLKLKVLRLNGNKIPAEVSKEIADLLVQSSIEHLDVAEIDITTSSLLNLISALKLSTLKIIDISRPIDNNFYNEFLARAIGSMLKINTSLTELHLQKYNFSCHDIETMLIEGKFNRTLQLIDLRCNNIGDHGVEYICNWIRDKPALSGLMLAHNIITDIGARALSFALPFSEIILLDISYNRIKDCGIRDLLNTIRRRSYLRIYGNKIESSAEIIERIIQSGVLVQNNLDVKPYKVDGIFYAAYYPIDNYKNFIFTDIDVPAVEPKQTYKILRDEDLTEHKDTKSSDIETLESSESQSETTYCYCKLEEKSSTESSIDWYKVKDSRMQKVMLILDKVDYDLRNYIVKWMNAADNPENLLDYLQ